MIKTIQPIELTKYKNQVKNKADQTTATSSDQICFFESTHKSGHFFDLYRVVPDPKSGFQKDQLLKSLK